MQLPARRRPLATVAAGARHFALLLHQRGACRTGRVRGSPPAGGSYALSPLKYAILVPFATAALAQAGGSAADASGVRSINAALAAHNGSATAAPGTTRAPGAGGPAGVKRESGGLRIRATDQDAPPGESPSPCAAPAVCRRSVSLLRPARTSHRCELPLHADAGTATASCSPGGA